MTKNNKITKIKQKLKTYNTILKAHGKGCGFGVRYQSDSHRSGSTHLAPSTPTIIIMIARYNFLFIIIYY